jgi:hypothetical protein
MLARIYLILKTFGIGGQSGLPVPQTYVLECWKAGKMELWVWGQANPWGETEAGSLLGFFEFASLI